MRVGIIAAIKPEAAAFRTADGALPGQHPFHVRVCGPGAENAKQQAKQMLQQGCGLLISWGLAGGLAPGFAAGQLVVGSEACTGSGERLGSLPCPEFELEPRLGTLQLLTARTVSVATPVGSAREKKALHERTGAEIVDMESQAIADVAREGGVAFAFVRAVVDGENVNLPAAALAGLDERGNPRPFRVMLSVARRPSQLPALVALGRDYRLALSALRRAASALTTGTG